MNNTTNDFYNYVNNKTSGPGTFSTARKQSETQVDQIIKTSSKVSGIGIIRDKLSNVSLSDPLILDTVNSIKQVNSVPELLSFCAKNIYLIQFPLFTLISSKHMTNSSFHTFEFECKRLPLKSPEVYLEEKYASIRSLYKEYWKEIICTFSLGSPSTIDEIFEGETKIAREIDIAAKIKSKTTSFPVQTLYSYLYPLDINDFLNEIYKLYPGTESDKVKSCIIVSSHSYFMQIPKILDKFTIETLKMYTIITFIHNYAPFLPGKISCLNSQIQTELFNEQPRSKEQRFNRSLQSIIGELISTEYNDRFISTNVDIYVQNLFVQIKCTFREMLDSLEWLSTETKELCFNKLNKMTLELGFSTQSFTNYELYLEILKTLYKSPLETVAAIVKYKYSKQINKINGTEQNDIQWKAQSHDINAYYDPVLNKIFVPRALLQEPFIDMESKSRNFGLIGIILAHELSHGFDNFGILYDVSGNQHLWWKETELEHYSKLVEPLVQQFNTHGLPGQKLLSENLADYTALSIIVNILRNNNVPIRTYMKTFESYAVLWKDDSSKSSVRNLIDVHSPNHYRVNQILVNIKQFRIVFKVPEPEFKLINIWTNV